MIYWIVIPAASLLLVLSALLAATEGAFAVTSRADLLDIAKNSRKAQRIEKIAEKLEIHLLALNLLRILCEVSFTILITVCFVIGIEPLWLAALLGAATVILAFYLISGISPRAIGRANPETFIKLTSAPVRLVRILLGPLASFLKMIGDRVTPGRTPTIVFTNEEQLLSMVDEATSQQLIEEDDRELIHSVFEFGDTIAREVMVPRIDMLTVDKEFTIQQALDHFIETGVSRMPVENNSPDEIAGMLYMKDVVKVSQKNPESASFDKVTEIMREATFIPEQMKVDDLLKLMQKESVHIALVVDEYGGIAGLVTMEDLIEEIVGDIEDEYDDGDAEVTPLSLNRYRVSVRLNLEELGDIFGLELEDEDVDTVGGFFAKQLGRLPKAGDQVQVGDLTITAVKPERRKSGVTQLIVESLAPEETEIDIDD